MVPCGLLLVKMLIGKKAGETIVAPAPSSSERTLLSCFAQRAKQSYVEVAYHLQWVAVCNRLAELPGSASYGEPEPFILLDAPCGACVDVWSGSEGSVVYVGWWEEPTSSVD